MRHILSAPIVMALAVAIPTLAAAPAVAQPAANKSTDDAVTEHYNKGAKAADAGQWDKARESFLEAWKLKPHYQIAANLGNAEVMLRRYRDAAEHLRFFLREAPSDVDAGDRKKAEQLFDEVKAKIGTVSVEVDSVEAEVTVDGTAVGISPILEPLFVDPGKHTFEAKRRGYIPARMPIDVVAGSSSTVTLHLVKAEGSVADGKQPPGSAQPPGSLQPPGSSGPTDGGRPPSWKPWAIGGGAVLAAAGIGVGIGFTFMSNAKGSKGLELADELVDVTPSSQSICGANHPATNQSKCDQITDLIGTRDTFATVAVVGYAVGGAAAIGTVLLAVLPRKPGTRSSRMQITPVLSPAQGGVMLTGSF